MPKLYATMRHAGPPTRQRGLLLTALLLLAGAASAQQLSGTYYVGSGASPDPTRTYPTLPAAMTALGAGVSTGASVTFTLLDASYSLGTNALVVPAVVIGAGQGVSIVPAAGVSPVISGSSTTALIDLNGTDFLTISGYDGSTSARTLTLRNTASAPAVLLRNDATNNTLRNLVLESANTGTSSGTVFFSTSTGTTGNDFNLLASCDLRPANNSTTVLPANGIYSQGTAGATNSDNTVRGCTIYNFTAAGLNVTTNSGDNWTVGGATAAEGNAVYETVSRSGDLRFLRLSSGNNHVVSNNQLYYASGTLSAAFYGVVMVGGTGHAVSSNSIGGSQAGAGGAAFAIGSTTGYEYPIYLDLSTTAGAVATTVQGNVIRNFASASTGIMYGVHARNGTAGIVTIQGNSIGGTGSGQGITHAGNFYGIDLGNAVGATVQNNTVAGITTTVANGVASQTGTLAGVNMSSSSASTISGNTFSNLSGTITNAVASSTVNATNASPVAGVYVSGSGAATITGNTVSGLSSTSTFAGGGTALNITLAGVWLSGSGAVAVTSNTISGLSAPAGGAPVFGIYSSGSGSGSISGNQLSGLSSNLATPAQLAGINSTGSGVVVIGNNTIANLSQSGATANLNGIQCTSAAGSNVTGNTITNVTYSGTSAGLTVYGIFATGSHSISSNTIITVQATAAVNANARGIYVGGSGAAATVSGNTVTNVLNATSGAGTNTAGIFVGPTSGVMGAVTVSDNRISNVGTSATTPPTRSNAFVVTGLLCGASAAGSVVERNRVWNVYGSSTGTGPNADQVRGLAVQGVYSGTFANNQISLAAGSIAQQTYGIQDLSSGGANSFYYNSVYLAPASGAATGISYGFWRSATSAPPSVELRNNLLYNGRTPAPGTPALAIGTASTTGWAATASNYNLFVSPNAAAVGNWGGVVLNFDGWKAAQPGGSGGDASSLRVGPADAPAASLFVDLATGNLDINAANPEAWYVNGNGVQLPGQAGDFGGAARATTVAAGGTDIGADEVTPTATPPALTASGAPVLGGTQVFSLGGRALASLTYGSTGTVPSLVVARYYSGTNPPPPFAAGARYANAYFTFADANNDGSGYAYQPTLTYDPALLGTVASEAAQRLSQRLADNSAYQTYAATTVDAAARTLTGPASLTRLGLLAISDQAAPLPVMLSRFAAVRREANVVVDWTTATEKNCAGYEIQVATDGHNFRKLGFVRASLPNSSTPQFYQFTDAEPGKTGLRYYRLRQLDLDGAASYSPMQAVSFGDATTAGLLAYPNPFGAVLSVAVSAPLDGPVPVTLTDAMGRTVLTRLVAPTADTNRLDLGELAALPAGVYLLRVALPGQTQQLRIMKN
ncbi:T9SS type A sorting domain-containing protein [Hymenobacter monticola]|uniref:Right-handed parallel beta-helix repeat-containing protein n=1 Tax=Hymenobacter monticola TaxID=1705399 RepID=A0ABY4B0V2_9BACT|nr:T9SS type A sorting domain-containing protein [Hymenobacter monticola]UOE32414.1 right-handed parallel beta-helix repeat-containing protein [Hymenobacter monticola]